ncbi:hypothetical protein ACLESD_47095, partial [Pyxidicoccus sp. 3LFB2]
MIEVPGFRVVKELATSSAFQWLRATREADGAPVTLKVPEASRSTAPAARLRHEFELTQALRLDGVLQALALVEPRPGAPSSCSKASGRRRPGPAPRPGGRLEPRRRPAASPW